MAALSDDELTRKCVYFIQQTFESRLFHEVGQLYKKYGKSTPPKSQFLEQLEYNERAKDRLHNLFVYAANAWNAVYGRTSNEGRTKK